MKLNKTLLTLSLLSAANIAHAGEVEVLHWWTAGGEAKSAALSAARKASLSLAGAFLSADRVEVAFMLSDISKPTSFFEYPSVIK